MNLEQPSELLNVATITTTGTQNISDEPLEGLIDCAITGCLDPDDALNALRELRQARRDLAAYRNAPCPFEQENEALREELRLQKGANAAQDERERNAAERLGMIHSCDWPEQVADGLEALRASYKKLVDVVRRAASINDGRPHNKWVRALGIQARAALAEAAKLEGK